MAVSRTVSFPDEMFKRMLDRAINPSKAAQLGARMVLEGGVDAFETMKKERDNIQKTAEAKQLKIEEQDKRLINLQKELNFAREKYMELVEETKKLKLEGKE